MSAGRSAVPLDVPVDPDAPEARRWLLEELEKDKYGRTSEAEPSWLDDWLRDIREWLASLFDGADGGDPVWWVIIVVAVVAALVVAFLLFGVPRLNRRSRAHGDLFSDEDERDSVALRRAATRAAEAGDYATAIAELFRALARVLSERTLVTTSPGTTAHGFARQAAAVFPDAAGRLASAADDFDAVRYLGIAGTAVQWRAMSELERELRKASPARETVTVDSAWIP